MISNRRIVNARRRVLRAAQTIRPALVEIVKKAMAIEGTIWQGSSSLGVVPSTNGDREPPWEQPLTLLIDEFLNELGEIPKAMILRELPIDNVLPGYTSPVFVGLKVNLGADPATQKIQELLRSIYRTHNTSVCLRLEVVQRAYWLSLGKKSEYTIRAKTEMEKNYFRY